jgi:hypothetical protein
LSDWFESRKHLLGNDSPALPFLNWLLLVNSMSEIMARFQLFIYVIECDYGFSLIYTLKSNIGFQFEVKWTKQDDFFLSWQTWTYFISANVPNSHQFLFYV